jgi:class 3 adenylate cyclase
MFDPALVKDLTEMMGKSLTFKDIEAVGGYLFKSMGYSSHSLGGVDKKVSISPLNAAKMLVDECDKRKKLKDLFAFVFELDGAPLNGRNVALDGLENVLFRLTRSGMYYDFTRRRFVDMDTDRMSLPGWGVLKSGKEYPLAVASVDICGNSELVRTYKPAVMEKIFYRLREFLRHKLELYDGRLWSWAGDGGLFAFRGDKGNTVGVSCCLEILFSLPVFNLRPDKSIKEDICLRIGMDFGPVKFTEDTGRIVSEVVNYAAHLEKSSTKPMGLSISDAVFATLPPSLKASFKEKLEFEGRTAHTTVVCFAGPVRPE